MKQKKETRINKNRPQVSKNSGAKIRKFKNDDYVIDYSKGWNGVLRCLKKILQLNYRGGSYYMNYNTLRGILSLRISGHNANGNNFNSKHINVSVFVALFVQ